MHLSVLQNGISKRERHKIRGMNNVFISKKNDMNEGDENVVFN